MAQSKIVMMDKSILENLFKLLDDFENATTDDTDKEWLSDGEWLDLFYEAALKIRNKSIIQV